MKQMHSPCQRRPSATARIGRSAYKYTDEDVRKIFRAIESQVDEIKAKFKGNDKLEFRL